MTQPRKPSGPGEWRKGDWLLNKGGGIAPLRYVATYQAYDLHDRNGAELRRADGSVFVLKDGGGANSRWFANLTFLARPVENDPEGWVNEADWPVPDGMKVQRRALLTDPPVHQWRPSTEPTSSTASAVPDELTERLTKVAYATEFLDVRADILALIERDRRRWLDNIAVCELLAEARANLEARASGAPDRPRR